MSKVNGSKDIFNITGDTNNVKIAAKGHIGRNIVFLKDTSSNEPNHLKQTRVWFVTKKMNINEKKNVQESIENLIDLSYIYTNIVHNKCVYDDEVMQDVSLVL